MFHHAAGTFRLLSGSSRTSSKQRGEVVKRLSLERLNIDPKHLHTADIIPYRATESGMRTKNFQMDPWAFTRIFAQLDKSDASLRFKTDREDYYDRT